MDTTDTASTTPKRSSWGKNLAKAVLTVVSPPIGLASLGKNGCSGFGFTLGLAVSAALSVPLIIPTGKDKIYDGAITVRNEPNFYGFPRYAIEALISPVTLYFDREPLTTLPLQGLNYVIRGDNIIHYNRQTGRYEVNFSEESDFKQPSISNSPPFYSVNDLKEAMAEIFVIEPPNFISYPSNDKSHLIVEYVAKKRQHDEIKSKLKETVESMNQKMEKIEDGVLEFEGRRK